MSVQNSHQISDIKVLLKIGANGNGIVSVEKTGTVGNVDTYTITFSDGTTTNFDLTNGTSIDTIEKTDTQGLVDTYTITLTDGSTTTFEVVNGTTSADVSAIVNVYGAKNFNSYPYSDTSKAEYGITWTDNGDGTIGATGEATARADFTFHPQVNSSPAKLYLPNGTYTLTGCPAGGAENTYYLFAGYTGTDGAVYVADFGQGVTFTINGSAGDSNGALMIVAFRVVSGVALPVDGITIKPMIRDARISDDTYVPYAKTNRELTEDKAEKIDVLKFLGDKSIYVTANGSKNVITLFSELHSELTSYLATKPSTYRFKVIYADLPVSTNANVSVTPTTVNLRDKTFASSLQFTTLSIDSSGNTYTWKASIESSGGYFRTTTIPISGSPTFSNLGNIVPNNGRNVVIKIEEYDNP